MSRNDENEDSYIKKIVRLLRQKFKDPLHLELITKHGQAGQGVPEPVREQNPLSDCNSKRF